MKQFNGFPTRMEFTPIPNVFLSSLLPQISDIAELKTTLHVFRVVYGKRGYPRFITYRELLSDTSLMDNLKVETKPPDEILFALFGGLLVGIGAAFARGCVVGNIMSGWALMSIGTIVFGIVTILANWVTTYIYMMGGQKTK